MVTQIPYIQIFEGVPEELSGVSLRREKSTGRRFAIFRFEKLESLEHFISFRKGFSSALHLFDEEGEIVIEPSGVQFVYGGSEGEDLRRVECKLEIDREDHWDRFLRFLDRYAEANGMEYGEPSKAPVQSN